MFGLSYGKPNGETDVVSEHVPAPIKDEILYQQKVEINIARRMMVSRSNQQNSNHELRTSMHHLKLTNKLREHHQAGAPHRLWL